jgi:hypothetical protein
VALVYSQAFMVEGMVLEMSVIFPVGLFLFLVFFFVVIFEILFI